jgi:hypothetical protein
MWMKSWQRNKSWMLSADAVLSGRWGARVTVQEVGGARYILGERGRQAYHQVTHPNSWLHAQHVNDSILPRYMNQGYSIKAYRLESCAKRHWCQFCICAVYSGMPPRSAWAASGKRP